MIQPPYSGAHGFYCCIYPHHQIGLPTLRSIVKTVAGVELEDPSKVDKESISFHCTVMYSKSALTGCSVAEAQRIARQMTGPVQARVERFNYWDGHDNEGYLVAELYAPDLARWHNVWKDLGAIPTFDEYLPHVTLATGEQAKAVKDKLAQMIAYLVARGDTYLVMNNLSITDLKE